VKARFANVRVAGVLGVVPARISRFDDELANFSQPTANSRKLKLAMGYDQHRVADAGTTMSDLACHGLRHLIDSGRLEPSTVDAIFFVSQTPDYAIPATSAVIHGRFGFPQETYCVDINDGCCGYIKGLYEAAAFVQATGAARVLLIAGDVLSPKVSPHDRNSYPLVGDAATITLIERSEAASTLDIEMRTDGAGWDKLMVPAGGARLPASNATAELVEDEDGNRRALDHLVMQGREVFAFTQTVVPDFILDFLGRRELVPADLDLLLLHQANAFILDRLRTKLGVGKDKLPDEVIRKYGNSSSGTIPMAIVLACRDGRTAPNTLACGFGVGLSWGAALFALDGLDFCALLDYPPVTSPIKENP
jgi:3-oxoacyl-[acyl-carrier-protein] synthase-3